MKEPKQDTELIIKEAARKVFQEKGFAATKTRDIAELADINLALLNYYFRSKKKLFDIIMVETLQSFFAGVITVLNNEETSLNDKVADFANHYMDLLTENQNMALFILHSVRENPVEYIARIGILDQAKESVFVRQFIEGVAQKEIPPLHPIHFMLNLMGLVVFPFIAEPMITAVSGMPKESYFEMIQERKRLIPMWVESMLSVK